MPSNESFETLSSTAAKLIYTTLDSVEDGTATKAGLEFALNELAMLMFLITRTPEQMKTVNACRKESKHARH